MRTLPTALGHPPRRVAAHLGPRGTVDQTISTTSYAGALPGGAIVGHEQTVHDCERPQQDRETDEESDAARTAPPEESCCGTCPTVRTLAPIAITGQALDVPKLEPLTNISRRSVHAKTDDRLCRRRARVRRVGAWRWCRNDVGHHLGKRVCRRLALLLQPRERHDSRRRHRRVDEPDSGTPYRDALHDRDVRRHGSRNRHRCDLHEWQHAAGTGRRSRTPSAAPARTRTAARFMDSR